MITINDADRNEFSSELNQNRQNTFVAGFRLEVYTMYWIDLRDNSDYVVLKIMFMITVCDEQIQSK
jgi:hypothetical protein